MVLFSISPFTFVCSDKQKVTEEALKTAKIDLFPSKASEVTVANIKQDSLNKVLSLLLEENVLSKTLYEEVAEYVVPIDAKGGLELIEAPKNGLNEKSQRLSELEALAKEQGAEFQKKMSEFDALKSFIDDEKNLVKDRAKAAADRVRAFMVKRELEALYLETLNSLLSELENSLTPVQKEQHEKYRVRLK